MKSIFFEADWRFKRNPITEHDMIFAPRVSLLRQAITLSQTKLRILDAACASGRFAEFFQNSGHEVVACDISFTALGLARQHRQIDNVTACDVQALPFRSNSFDAIWMGESIALLDNVHAALSEFNRVLRPDGWMALTTPYYGRLKNMYIALFCFDRHYYPEDYRIRHFTKASLLRVLHHNGFARRHWAGIGRFKWFWRSQYVLAVKTNAPKPKPNWHRERSSAKGDYTDSPLNANVYSPHHERSA